MAPSGKAMSAALGVLAPNGKLLVIGAPGDPIEVPALVLITGRRSVEGAFWGTSIDSEDTVRFSVENNVRPINEVFPFDQAAKAYERMTSGRARFRCVLEMKR